MKLLRRLFNASLYVMMAFSALFLLLYPWIDAFLPDISNKAVLGVVLGIIFAFVIHFDKQISGLYEVRSQLGNMKLADAINSSLEAMKFNVNELNVYALTTAVIFPIFRDSRVHVKNCKIMLHKFDESGPVENAKALNDEINQVIKKWETLKSQGKIDNLSFVRYDDYPGNYVMVFDESFAIVGNYHYNDKSPYGNDYLDPVLIRSNSIESSAWVKKLKHKFTDSWAYWKKKSGQV